ncbi:MAG: hypothetical protein JRI23_04255 [Deltaproteobacteria bacterium]|nr:hypothetical protein [Deltaproteobacteria bacterium]MBW2530747.1 hypothetical protein [Deltaproteobacteria bacterium]
MTQAAAQAEGSGAPGRWIVSRRVDLAIFLTPLVLATLTLPLYGHVRGGDIPLAVFVFVIIAFDVAHVWATIYRVYLDPVELRRRPVLYLASVPLFFVAAFRLHSYSATAFWTVLAYVAIFHFIKQLYGFVAIYRLRAGERAPFDYHLDKIAVWVGALGPVLWWHASPRRQFDWFNAGESFLVRLPPEIISDLTVVYGSVALVYVGRQLQVFVARRHFNAGKNLLMSATWLTWAVGIRMADSPIVSAAFLNLIHGIPFLVLVWLYCHRKWHGPASAAASASGARAIRWLSARSHVWAFYLLVFGLALLEEGLWDGLVWQHYLPTDLGVALPELSAPVTSLAVATLSLPQILHYFLDAFIWRFDGSNPNLRELVLGPPAPRPAA